MSRSLRLLSRTTAAVLALSFTVGVAQGNQASPDVAPRQGHNASATAQWVQVDSAWIRATVKGQTATGGFMVLTARQPLTLEGFSMTRPGVPELHEMTMDGQVMRMRAISTLALPAGQAVVLRPGGQHLMLTQLQGMLKEGDALELTLKLRTADGKAVTQTVSVPIKGHMMMPGTPGQGVQHHHGMAH
jgi:periplasmic copper chaperone A